MNSNHLPSRKINYVSVVGLTALLLMLSNVFFISALAAEEPAKAGQAEAVAEAAPARIPPLVAPPRQVTPTTWISFFPIVHLNSGTDRFEQIIIPTSLPKTPQPSPTLLNPLPPDPDGSPTATKRPPPDPDGSPTATKRPPPDPKASPTATKRPPSATKTKRPPTATKTRRPPTPTKTKRPPTPTKTKRPPQPVPANCNPSWGSGGLKPGTYERKIGALRTTIVVSSKYNPNKPTYLAFYLHGDDGDYTRFKNPNNPVTRFIEEQGWVFIAPQSSHPNIHWYKDADRQVREVDQVFQKMFADYNLCRNTILGATISGGSTFISGHFFPERGRKYPMHVNLICLGWTDRDARQKIKQLGKNSSVVSRSSFKFTYGDKDPFIIYIIPTIKVYRQAGFKVTVEEQAGVGHCPRIGPEMIEHWEVLIKQLDLD